MDKLIKKRILSESDYKFSDYNEYGLSDNIVLYNINDEWKIIPLSLLLTYQIIYSTSIIDDETCSISIILCPITLRCVIFKDKYIFEKYSDNTMILKKNNNIFPIDSGEIEFRLSTNITTLKNALLIAPDAEYMICNKKIDPIINMQYYNNNLDINEKNLSGLLIHPKTLVYIIQYKSGSHEKTSIILGRDITKDYVSGYNLKTSGFYDYLEKYRSKIINREGYIMPMLWYLAKDIYNEAKIINSD